MSEQDTSFPPSGDAVERRNDAAGVSGRADGSGGSETRVEWGVQWSTESTWGYGDDRQAAESAIREELRHPNWANRPTLLTRTVTTSAWVPVTDDRTDERQGQ